MFPDFELSDFRSIKQNYNSALGKIHGTAGPVSIDRQQPASARPLQRAPFPVSIVTTRSSLHTNDQAYF